MKKMYKRLFTNAEVKTLANMCEGDEKILRYVLKRENEANGRTVTKESE